MYQIPDVNVLVAAMNHSAEFHQPTQHWLRKILGVPQFVGLLPETISGAIRVLTLPIGDARLSSAQAQRFVSKLMDDEFVVLVRPSERQLSVFFDFCRRLDLKANDAGDAMLAAAAIVMDSTIVTWDRGFSRFPGLTWQTPADAQSVTNPR